MGRSGRDLTTGSKRLPRNPQADRAVAFINALTHIKGAWAGQTFQMRPWQEAIIRTLFGTLSNGVRQYRTCYVEIPRKNGKTELAAAIALYMLLADGESGAEVYSAAVDLEQASLAFNVAAQMVRNDDELHGALEIIPSRKRIVQHSTGSFYRAIPAEAASAHGYNASAVIYDELHAAPNRELWDVLTTSMGARSQPLTFVITTAGFDRHSICWELHDHAERVRDGARTDPTFLPVLFGAPREADWLDEGVWRAANPALGDFRSLDEMRTMARQARDIPARQNTFRRLYLCQWTESESRWLDPFAWQECGTPVDPEALRGRRCFAGLDASTTTDLTAFVLVFPDDHGGFDVLPYFWIPADTMKERIRRDRVPYDVWARDGHVRVTEGNSVDYDIVREDIKLLAAKYDIVELARDRWNTSQLATQLMADGATVIDFGQGYASMSAPAKELERLVLARAIRHGNHPVLATHAGAVVIEMDAAGNIKPSKRKTTERIDGIPALIMGLGRAIVSGDGRSVYDERDLRVV